MINWSQVGSEQVNSVLSLLLDNIITSKSCSSYIIHTHCRIYVLSNCAIFMHYNLPRLHSKVMIRYIHHGWKTFLS